MISYRYQKAIFPTENCASIHCILGSVITPLDVYSRHLMEVMPDSIYRKRNSQNYPYYQCGEEHFDTFELVYDDRFERQYGFFRPYIKQVNYHYLHYGVLKTDLGRVRCEGCPIRFRGDCSLDDTANRPFLYDGIMITKIISGGQTVQVVLPLIWLLNWVSPMVAGFQKAVKQKTALYLIYID